jgi:hypothetical protein
MKHKRLIVVVLGAGALAALALQRRAKAATSGAPGGTGDGFSAAGPLQVVEVETKGVDGDGNAVVDDLMVAVDNDGKIVATAETVAIISPTGDVVVDETLSVVGEDGKLHTVEEDIAVLEADDE